MDNRAIAVNVFAHRRWNYKTVSRKPESRPSKRGGIEEFVQNGSDFFRRILDVFFGVFAEGYLKIFRVKCRVLRDHHPDDLLAQSVAQLRVGHGEELLDAGQLVEFFVEIGEFVFDDLAVFVFDLLTGRRSADLRTGSRLHAIVQNAVPALQILIPLIVDLFLVLLGRRIGNGRESKIISGVRKKVRQSV